MGNLRPPCGPKHLEMTLERGFTLQRTFPRRVAGWITTAGGFGVVGRDRNVRRYFFCFGFEFLDSFCYYEVRLILFDEKDDDGWLSICVVCPARFRTLTVIAALRIRSMYVLSVAVGGHWQR